MHIHTPKFVALDSSTLGQLARDHWSGDSEKHSKAKALIEALRDGGIYVVVSYTHLCELLRHDDDGIAKERIAWLGTLPMVAWIRPYSDHWWVGGMADIALRELSAIVHHSAKDWAEVIGRVRVNLLETGVGSDMFVDRPELWSMVRSHARDNLENQIYIASLARSDYGNVYDRKFKEFGPLERMPHGTVESHLAQAVQTARGITERLVKHGDARIAAPEAATTFVADLMNDLAKVQALGGDPYEAVVKHYGIPREMVGPETTIGQIGELGVQAAHLKLLQQALNPPATVSLLDAPPNAMPSFTVERELLREQQGAERVDGSDLGDCHLVPLALYLDAVQVDRRAHDHVRKMRHRNTRIAAHLGQVFRSPNYQSIATQLSELGVL